MNLRFFNPPHFEVEEDNNRAKFINGFAWTGIALLVVGIFSYLLTPSGDFTVFILAGLIAVLVISLILWHRRQVAIAGWILVVLGWIGIGLQAFTADGVKDVIIMAFVAIGLLASILINRVAGIVIILASIGQVDPALQRRWRRAGPAQHRLDRHHQRRQCQAA